MDPKDAYFDSTALRYFRAAAALKSVRRAAEALHVSPSALSRQIARLENDLSVPLFKRLPRGLMLTSAGETLLYHVEQSFRELERAQQAIVGLKAVRRDRVLVALVESAARGLLPPVLSAFWSKHADIQISARVAGSHDVVRLLERGEVDIGVAFNVPKQADLHVLGVARLHLGAVMSAKHRFARRRSLCMQELVGFPLFLSDSSLMLGAALDNVQKALPLNVRLVTNSITVMTLLSASQNGMALKTRMGLADELLRRDLSFVPLRNKRLPVQRLTLVMRRGALLPAVIGALAEEFLAALKDVDEA